MREWSQLQDKASMEASGDVMRCIVKSHQLATSNLQQKSGKTGLAHLLGWLQQQLDCEFLQGWYWLE